MIWWLWHNVGHRDLKRKLSYNDIASITRVSRSTVQVTIEQFQRKLENKLDGHLLGQLLRTANLIG